MTKKYSASLTSSTPEPSKFCKHTAKGTQAIANLLVEREVILAADVEEILGRRPWKSRTEEELLKANEEQ